MAPTVRVQTGEKEFVGALIIGRQNERLSGLSNIMLAIRRVSDGNYFDWSDNYFKPFITLTQFYETLIEPDSSNNPGFYHLHNATHQNGEFDFSAINNKVASDTYHFTVIQEAVPQTASNVPQIGEIKEGGFIDYIDSSISGAATPSEVQDELRAIRLHQLLSVNPGAIQAGTGTYIKQIIDLLGEKPSYVVLQTYSYNQTSDRLDGIVWVESGDIVFNSASLGACTVNWYDRGGVLQWSEVDAAPDTQGFYKIEKATPGLALDSLYYAVAEVEITGVGTISGGKGNFTF